MRKKKGTAQFGSLRTFRDAPWSPSTYYFDGVGVRVPVGEDLELAV